MNFATWARWLAWLAAETTALVCVAAILHLWLRSPRAGRTLWRSALTAVALVWIVELSGLREKMAKPVMSQRNLILTATLLTTPEPQAQASGSDLAAGAEPHPAVARAHSSQTRLPLWIWLGGSVLLLGRFCLARLWLERCRRAAASAGEDSLLLIARWQDSFALRRVHSQVWAGLRGPVAFGVFRPSIALPPDFAARFSHAEREAMLAHEMAHLAARDPFWWMVSDAVVALAWWHPLVWWARCQLQSAHEAAADEASALIPGGPQILAECLVRLGRELTASGPARALGIGGNGPRSQLATRVKRLVLGPRSWRPLSIWARWTPHTCGVFIALATAYLPVQAGLPGSILAVLAVSAPARADASPIMPAPIASTHQAETASPLATVGNPNLVTPPAPTPEPTTSQPETPTPVAKEQPDPKEFAVASPASVSDASSDARSNVAASVTAFSPAIRDVATNARPKVQLLIQFASLTEPSSAELGLDWLFGQPPTNNPVPEIDHDWTFGLEPQGVPKAGIAHPHNLLIDHLRTDGQAAVLNPGQFAALRDRLLLGSGDLLTAPKCLAFSGQKACVATLNVTNVVTGVEAKAEPANVGYFADTIGVGPTVEVVPTVQTDGRWRLRVRASLTCFLGYDKHPDERPTFSVPGGKLMGYEIPHPHFRALEAEAEDSLLLGETLALRGPLWTETTKTKGHFLARAKTKTIRQRLYIFVTPTLPPPSEIK